MAGWFEVAMQPYIPPACTVNCRPKPDGSSGAGWTLIALGVLAVVGAVVLLLIPQRPTAEAAPEAAPPEPVAMDRAQREDLAQRATAKAEAEAAEAEKQNASLVNFAGGLVVVGLAAAGFGVFLVAMANSAIDDDKKELRQAASLEVTLSVDGPMDCRQSAASFPTADPSGVARCSSSPRSYTNRYGTPSTGVLPIEFVLSSGFAANGEVTVHDKLNHRSLCVRVPDTDVMAAAHPETLTASYYSAPSFDADPYIASGVCPDAPVTTP